MTITKKPGYWIERERVAPVIQEWVDKHRSIYDSTEQTNHSFGRVMGGSGGLSTLAFMTGVGVRSLHRIMSTDQEYVSLDLVDRLLTGMDQIHLFHLPPEQGGFADVYEHPEIMGMAA